MSDKHVFLFKQLVQDSRALLKVINELLQKNHNVLKESFSLENERS